MKGNIMAFCHHIYRGNKKCTCGRTARHQFRTYIRLGDERSKSIAYSIYKCIDCSALFLDHVESHLKEMWTIKISTKHKYLMRGNFNVNTNIHEDESTEEKR